MTSNDARMSGAGGPLQILTTFALHEWQASDFIKFVNGRREAEPPGDGFWDDVPHSDLLHHLKSDTWEKFVADNSKALLLIYDAACPNCQILRKEIAECAKSLQQKNNAATIGTFQVDLLRNGVRHLWTPSTGVPTLLWFRNGVKEVEYEGPRSSESLLRFIERESKEVGPDWSLKDSAEDIYHLDDQGFINFLDDHDEALIFFYSPTSDVCHQIQPQFEEAATLLDELKPEAALAAVNIRKAPTLKKQYEVNSTPKFLYFKNGNMKFEYHGQTKAEDFVDFLLKPTFVKKPEADDDWSLKGTNVTVLKVKTLLPFVKQHKQVLVMFYAPWCGHCKKFKPEFIKAGDMLEESLIDGKLAAINGNKEKDVNSRYNVKGFPTLVYFRDSEYVTHYKGARSAKAVVDFMLNSGVAPKPQESTAVDIISETRPEEVALLVPDNFQDYLDEHEDVMVMFYAPWCGTCKKAKKPFFEAAFDIDEDLEDSSLAIFNAYQHAKFADPYVEGYPTFWFFKNGERLYRYGGTHTKEAFINFMADPHEDENLDKGKDGTQWISEVSDVKHLSRENFDRFLQNHKSIMMFFYINACEYCLSTLKPRFVEAAGILADENPDAVMAAMNGDWEKTIASKYHVNGFPTFLYFREGKMLYRYQGPTDVGSIVKFMKNPSEALAKRKKPTSWQDITGTDYGRVKHLSNLTYDTFLEEHKTALVMFHSAWYTRCIGPREEFKVASDKLPSEIGMGAVDCHRKPEQGVVCYNLKVQKFPSFKYYRNGQYAGEFDSDNAVADDFVLFASKMSQRSRDEL